MAAPPRLVAMRNAGLLGRKSGRGFYTLLGREADGLLRRQLPRRARPVPVPGAMSSNASSVTACMAAVAAEERSRVACSGATPAARSAAASASIRSVTFRAVDSGRMSDMFDGESAVPRPGEPRPEVLEHRRDRLLRRRRGEVDRAGGEDLRAGGCLVIASSPPTYPVRANSKSARGRSSPAASRGPLASISIP